jgi:putative flippase GtrA
MSTPKTLDITIAAVIVMSAMVSMFLIVVSLNRGFEFTDESLYFIVAMNPEHPVFMLSSLQRCLGIGCRRRAHWFSYFSVKHLVRLLPIKLLRYATVGVANAIIYGVSTAFYIHTFGIDGKIGSVLGYCTALPFAFIAHRSYTFSSQGAVKIELLRFAITHATSLLVSLIAMAAAIDYFGLHYAFGIIGGVVLVPIVTFLALDLWVFSDQNSSSGHGKWVCGGHSELRARNG